MDALKKLKAACERRGFKSFAVLAPGEYTTRRFTLVETTLGQRIRVDLDEMYVYLPGRFAHNLDPDTIATLNASPKKMIFSGKDPQHQNRLILDFENVDNTANDSSEPNSST